MELLDHEAEALQKLDADTTTEMKESAETTVAETVTPVSGEDRTQPVTVGRLIGRLKEIAAMADADINADEVSRIKQQFYYLRNEALRAAAENATATDEVVTDDASPVVAEEGVVTENTADAAFDADEETFKALLSGIKEKKAAMRARIEAQQLANLERKNAIIAEIQSMSSDTDNVNRHYPRVKELQSEFKAVGEVPQQNSTETWKNYQDAVEYFYDQWKVNKELRDYDFKKNLAEKQLLIDEAAKLGGEPDVVTAFRRLQELHDKWREIGPVAKEFREEIWTRFKDLSADVNKRYQSFFEERKKREQENEAAKTALCERIEAIDFSALKGYSSWNKATQVIIDAQEEWKKLGYASRKANNALFSRFRQSCDRFFAAKAEFFHSMKDELARNLEAKVQLCEAAEALKDSTDWKRTADRMVELQKQWKTIGAVPKKQSDLVWKRFLAACDCFFNRKKADASSTRKTEQANLAAKRAIVAELTALNSPDADTPRDEAIARINALRARWQETGHVPFREKEKLHDAYREVVRQLFDKYDIHETRARQASFEASINELSADKQKLGRERERLMRAYESRRNELATYENNLGFFNSKSKSGESMLREVQRNIQRIKADIADLENKIRLIDSKF